MSIQNMSDADFLGLMNSMAAAISADLVSYLGITAAMMTTFGAVRDNFSDKLLAHNTAQDAARAARVDKDSGRVDGEEQVRTLRDLMKAHAVTDTKYAALGIPQAVANVPATATVPVATVDTSQRLRHTIKFTDSADAANKRRPRGTVGSEIWVKIDGPPPGDEKDCTFLALDSATPYVAEYTPAESGKMAHYLLRWQLRDGSRTAFGETVSATITA
jgi:hypothetical protein